MHLFSRQRLAVLVADGFELPAVTVLQEVMARNGIIVDLVASTAGNVRLSGRGAETVSARSLDGEPGHPYHGVVIPAGLTAANFLRSYPKVRTFVSTLVHERKVIAAIGDGVSVILGLGLLEGRIMTAPDHLRTGIVDDGAVWMNQGVVTDGRLVTARSVAEGTGFVRAVFEALSGRELSIAV